LCPDRDSAFTYPGHRIEDDHMNNEGIKQLVKRRYSLFAERGGGQDSCCCPTSATGFAAEHGLYSQEELAVIPETALSLSRGCGNPAGFANLQRGEVVVDFGCGARIDVILATHKLGCLPAARNPNSLPNTRLN
jgi:hypothetical protein